MAGVPLSSIIGNATNLAGGVLGSVFYQSAPNTSVALAPNTTTTRKFLRQTGTGTVGAAPDWDTLTSADMPAFTGGDVTSSAGSGTLSIGTNKVTLGQMAQVATASFLGRSTAGTGNVEALSVAQVKTLLNLTGTNSGDQTITLTGDVTGSGTGSFAATIGANKVTLGQMAQVATGTFLGRTTASMGNVEALTVAQAKTLLALVKADVGLGNVDNTSDATKFTSPAFTGTATAVNMTVSGYLGVGGANNNTYGQILATGAGYQAHASVSSGGAVGVLAANGGTDVRMGAVSNHAVSILQNNSVSATVATGGQWTFTTYPLSPTPPAYDNTTKSATTAFVYQNAVWNNGQYLSGSNANNTPNVFLGGVSDPSVGLTDGGWHDLLSFGMGGSPSDSYHTQITRSWFSQDLYTRAKVGSTTYGSWRKIWDAGNFNPANYAALASSPAFTGTATAVGVVSTNGVIRSQGFGGTAGSGVVYFGDVATDNFIYKFGSQFQFKFGSLVANLSSAGTIWTDTNLVIGNYATLASPALTGTPTAGGFEIGYRDLPRVTGGFERGKVFAAASNQTLNTGPAAGTTYSFYNDSAGAMTLIQGAGLTLRVAGTATTGNYVVPQRGFVTIWYNSTTEAIIL